VEREDPRATSSGDEKVGAGAEYSRCKLARNRPVQNNATRSREFPFWLTRFPTSESYPAIAGRCKPPGLGGRRGRAAWYPHANPRGETSVAIQGIT
jgi:hypothetical protein